MSAGGGNWVFGYGSLMWRPGFRFAEQQAASVRGYHRSLCVFSHVHRGTPEVPGLVLGLDRGGMCRGLAFRVDDADWEQVVAYLREREQVTGVYREIRLHARLGDGRTAACLAYAVERRHHQYAGRLTRAELLRLVAQGNGQSGANREYVVNTYRHLEAMNIHDETLGWLTSHLDDTP